MKGLACAAALAALTLACNADRARHDDTGRVGTTGERDRADRADRGSRKFIQDMMQADMAEIELGKLALSRAQHADVKQFAQMMVDDHTKSLGELEQIASSHGVEAPVVVDEHHRDKLEDLSKLDAKGFDKQYMQLMVDDHEQKLDKVQTRTDEHRNASPTPESADNALEAAANQFAAKGLPNVSRHLDRAKAINEKL